MALNHVEIDGGFPSLFGYLGEDERGLPTPGFRLRPVQGDFLSEMLSRAATFMIHGLVGSQRQRWDKC